MNETRGQVVHAGSPQTETLEQVLPESSPLLTSSCSSAESPYE